MKHRDIFAIVLLLLILMLSSASCRLGENQIPCSIKLENNIRNHLKVQDKERELTSIDIFTNVNTQAIGKIRKVLNKATINNIFHYGEIKYLDYSIDNIRYISEIHPDGQINKYAQVFDENQAVEVYVNRNNQSITEIATNSLISTDNGQIGSDQSMMIDPICQSNQYIFPYMEKETYREKVAANSDEYITIHETFDDFYVTKATYIKIDSVTTIAGLALSLRVSLNAAYKWLESSGLSCDTTVIIPEGTLICINKVLDFRYGRDIYLNGVSTNRKQIYSAYSRGTMRYTLKTQGFLYNENSCVEYMVIERPTAMKYCDEYYRDLGFRMIRNLN